MTKSQRVLRIRMALSVAALLLLLAFVSCGHRQGGPQGLSSEHGDNRRKASHRLL